MIQSPRRTTNVLALNLDLILILLSLLRLGVLPPFWQMLILFVCLLVALLAFLMLWSAPPTRWGKVYSLLFGSIFLLPAMASLLLIYALAHMYGLVEFGGAPSAGILALFSGLVITCFLTFLLRWRWRTLKEDFQGPDQPLEVKAALEQIKDGWGITPQEARKQGILLISIGLGLGVGLFCIGACSVPINLFSWHHLWGIQLTGLPEGPVGKLVFLALGILTLLGGLIMLVTLPKIGWRLMRYWRQGYSSSQEQITIQGQVVGMWFVGKGQQAKLLIKVQPPTGVGKLFLVEPRFVDFLPGNAQQEVRIEYLSGTEAIVSVTPLA